MTENKAIKGLTYLISGKSNQYPPDYDLHIQVAITALEEIQQYRSIGTVEECREAVEKQKVKKWHDFSETEEVIICPVCLSEWNVIDNDTERFKYCPKCGQHMDKSGEVFE